MKKLVVLLLIFFCTVVKAQYKVVPLYTGTPPGTENWNWKEKEMFSTIWNTQVVYNVAQPTLTVYLPDKSIATGVSVVIAPGGGFFTLSINSEGIDVAKWLNAKGIAAFVLKYRLGHSKTEDPVKELMGIMMDSAKMSQATIPVIPMAIQDGLQAMKYVREHATEYNLDPAKIGFIGFSAGGTVTMGVTLQYSKESRPDFSAPIYANIGNELSAFKIPTDAPPLFICAASDDQLQLGPHSTNLYAGWIAAGKQAELHMYAKGGHGFGMRKQNLSSDKWIERFYEWLWTEGFIKKSSIKNVRTGNSK